jgi:hypothetical protein
MEHVSHFKPERAVFSKNYFQSSGTIDTLLLGLALHLITLNDLQFEFFAYLKFPWTLKISDLRDFLAVGHIHEFHLN